MAWPPLLAAVLAALALVPVAAEVATITDLDAIRARLGVPDLTSDDLMSDRRDFWDRVEREAVLLTDGLLRDDSSLDPLAAVSVSFADDVATAWLGPGRQDLVDRADLVDGWPTTGPIGFADGFTGTPGVDPGSGRIGLHVANPSRPPTSP